MCPVLILHTYDASTSKESNALTEMYAVHEYLLMVEVIIITNPTNIGMV